MSGHLQALARAWRRRHESPPATAMDPVQAFLPAALEILERPPSPLGRTIVWLILLLVTSAVGWAAVSRVEIVAVAQGRIIPSGNSRIVQPLERGVVRSIMVQDGDHVNAGDLLVVLDDTQQQAQARQLEQELTHRKAEMVRLHALVDGLGQGEWPGSGSLQFPQDMVPAQIRLQQQRFLQQAMTYDSERASLLKRKRQQQARLDASRALTGKLEQILPLIARRVENLQRLVEKQMAPEQQYLELKQQLIETRQDLAVARLESAQAAAEIGQTGAELTHLASMTKGEWLTALAMAEEKTAQLEQALIQARSESRRMQLHAPVTGQVQQLAIHTIGGVVTPAQVLMKIVPDEDRLEVEALLPNKDIGFVAIGQPAEIKVTPFPFTRYGTLQGRVSTISNDAVEWKGVGLAYVMRLQLDEDRIRVGKRRIRLSPGMAVTAEVKTGQRRLIEYFLSPLLRYRSESVRER